MLALIGRNAEELLIDTFRSPVVLYFLIGTHICPHQPTIKQCCFSGLILSGMLLLQVTRLEAMDMDGVPLAAAFANSFVPQLFQVSFQR